ncbi:hypothetical protein BDP27DRAFT_1338921 [Rhodocollybia butyracea]|uniref:Uncharacterized protein n=1 Tax=Rhodocollybia butyracea TaxID=206335 RepID=A0A9P5P8J5_9AGAR|nr:hypothetical protein BDP27DRAFT_1338921 [Rhodocollybia butyracea]
MPLKLHTQRPKAWCLPSENGSRVIQIKHCILSSSRGSIVLHAHRRSPRSHHNSPLPSHTQHRRMPASNIS